MFIALNSLNNSTIRKILLVFILMQGLVLTLISQTVSTNAEVYNFDISDVFHYHEVMGGGGSATNKESNIVQKSF